MKEEDRFGAIRGIVFAVPFGILFWVIIIFVGMKACNYLGG